MNKPIHTRPPRLLFIDSGLGGLTVLQSVTQAAPEATIYYIADDAWFPYGLLTQGCLIERLQLIIDKTMLSFEPDCIVIACNTASTLALPALRERFSLPIVGTVPAIKPASLLTQSGLVSILATPATITRDYTRTLINEYGSNTEFNLVAAIELAALAENHASGIDVDHDEIFNEIAPCFIQEGDRQTDIVVLGCTHYPLLLPILRQLSPWLVTWLDPSPAIARHVANTLMASGFIIGVGMTLHAGTIAFTSGRSPNAALCHLFKKHNLDYAITPSIAVTG